MAESSVAFLLEKLGDLVSQEASLFGAVEGGVKQLRDELEWIRLFLEYADAERRYDKRFKLWVNQVRVVAFDAEDVIDEFMFKVERKRQQRRSNLKFLNFLPACLSFVDKLLLAHELSGRITDINTTLERILVNKKRYGIEYPGASEAGSSSVPWSYSNQMVARKEKRLPTVEETNVVGMKNDVEAIKRKLLEGAMERVVVAIWGMGGLGKTTLAKKIYNDSAIENHFSCRAWVYVSQEYNIRELLLGIVNCLLTTLTDEQKRKNEIELGEEVRKCLLRKKYLIVLDDVWNTNVWQGLSSYFPPNQSNKSRVLITTRNQGIAMDARSDCHQLQPLGGTESWDLFLNKVGSTAAEWEGLKEFKDDIVKKCHGLPLGIVVLGGLLSMKDVTQHSWRKVLDSKDWLLSQGPDSCLGLLALSYNDLPSYLKPCFLYCGIFPEDSEINASKLMSWWVAEGFVQKRGKETLEDIAEDYLYELIQRSMIQVAETRADGRVKSCRMHDLLRDIAISEAKEEKLFEVDENIDVDLLPSSSVRRLISTISPHLQNSNIRSLILNRSPIDGGAWVFLHKSPKLLRVLYMNLGSKLCLPKQLGKIGELIHLKYLCLRGFRNSVRLPPSIGRLVNLQTLDSDFNVIYIPHTIWKLQQMRHLNCWLGEIWPRQSMRERWVDGHLGVHQMTNLETLSLQGGNWLKGHNLGKLTRHLKQLKLDIRSHPDLKEWCFRSIAQLTGLQKLSLFCNFRTESMSTSNAEVVSSLESFSNHKCLGKLCIGGIMRKLPAETTFYPPNLMQLQLYETRLEADPMLILGKLPNLRILKLFRDSYLGTKMNCPHEGFLQLEFLQIQELCSLEDFSVEEEAMPNLKTLKIEWCHQMLKLPDGLLQLEKLQRLHLYPPSPELMKDVSDKQREDWDRIRHIINSTTPRKGDSRLRD